MEKTGKKKKKNKGGRPSLWVDPQQLQDLIDKYFENEKQPTFAGLAYYIGIDRGTLYNYEKKDEFFNTIKKARAKMLQVYENLLIYNGKNTAGIIFALKNTGWSDKTEVDHTSKGERIVGFNYLPPVEEDEEPNSNDSSNEETA